jgi:CheY-like chemotaxis protein
MKRIMIVDDEEVIRKYLSKILSDLGYKVNVCAGGVEAVRKVMGPPRQK